MRRGTVRHTDARDQYTFRVVYDSLMPRVTSGLFRREQAQSDASSWRQKYETAAAAAESEEAEEMSSKRKKQMLTARMTEYETQLASAVAKTAALEKIKNQLQLDTESFIMQLDKVDIHCTTCKTRIWANAQRDGRPAEYRWCPLLNAAKFG